MAALILASTSAYRRELLARLAVPFETLPPGVSEAQIAEESPADRALRLSLEKARAVVRSHPQAIVIGSDQVAACGDRLLEKPGDAPRARAQLESVSGRSVLFYTACAVLGGTRDVHLAHVDTTTVLFREIGRAHV